MSTFVFHILGLVALVRPANGTPFTNATVLLLNSGYYSQLMPGQPSSDPRQPLPTHEAKLMIDMAVVDLSKSVEPDEIISVEFTPRARQSYGIWRLDGYDIGVSTVQNDPFTPRVGSAETGQCCTQTQDDMDLNWMASISDVQKPNSDSEVFAHYVSDPIDLPLRAVAARLKITSGALNVRTGWGSTDPADRSTYAWKFQSHNGGAPTSYVQRSLPDEVDWTLKTANSSAGDETLTITLTGRNVTHNIVLTDLNGSTSPFEAFLEDTPTEAMAEPTEPYFLEHFAAYYDLLTSSATLGVDDRLLPYGSPPTGMPSFTQKTEITRDTASVVGTNKSSLKKTPVRTHGRGDPSGSVIGPIHCPPAMLHE